MPTQNEAPNASTAVPPHGAHPPEPDLGGSSVGGQSGIGSGGSQFRSTSTGHGNNSAQISIRGRPSAGQDPVLIGNLRLFADKRWGLKVSWKGAELSDCALIPKADPRFKLLSHCIHIALSVLEHEVGNTALFDTATKIIQRRRQLKLSKEKKEQDLSENVTIPYNVDGMTHNCAWGTDIKQYEPKFGGRLYINQCMVDQAMNIANAVNKLEETIETWKQKVNKEQDAKKKEQLKASWASAAKEHAAMKLNYENAVYHLAATISHELCHLFTGFLTGCSRPRTPDTVTAAGYEDGDTGEHGCAWEYRVFNGCTFFFAESQFPPEMRAGTPYAHNDDRIQISWYKLKPDFISKFIKLDFSSCKGSSTKSFEAFNPGKGLLRSSLPDVEMRLVRKKMMESGFKKVKMVYPVDMPQRRIPMVQRSVLSTLNTMDKFSVTSADIRLPLRASALRVA